jgi:hypothetical protein
LSLLHGFDPLCPKLKEQYPLLQIYGASFLQDDPKIKFVSGRGAVANLKDRHMEVGAPAFTEQKLHDLEIAHQSVAVHGVEQKDVLAAI